MTEDEHAPRALSDSARAAYALVVKNGSIPVTSDLEGLRELADLGLLDMTEDGGDFVPVDPRLVELQVAGEWRRQAWYLALRATALERDITALTTDYVQARGAQQEGIRYLNGLREIGRFVDVAARGATVEILTAQPGGQRSTAVLESALPLALDQLDRGVRLRTLYQHSARFNEPTKTYVREVGAHGGEVRTLDEFFERIFIIDQKMAILPASPDRKTAVAVTEPAVVAFLTDMFERNWQRATQFTPSHAAVASSEVVPEIHVMIKRLLKEGVTDSAIAKRIGVSERTYHTHLARIRKELGAVNRVQLGYMLALEDLRSADIEELR